MFSFDTDTTLRLIQISDTHLSEPENGHLLGMQTLHSLVCVLDMIQQNHSFIDGMLVTGDLSQDGSLMSYQRLDAALSTLPYPTFWIPGNHDDLERMQQTCVGTTKGETILRSPHWQIVMLNSQVVGKVHGYLEDSELHRLEQALNSAGERYTMVCFHHHPVSMHCRWIDPIGIRNSEKLLELVARYPRVKVLLWGHVHQESDNQLNGMRLLSTPSTCVQFAPLTEDFTVDCRGPGYRWIDLHPDGTISTGVERVNHIEFEVDYSVKGY